MTDEIWRSINEASDRLMRQALGFPETTAQQIPTTAAMNVDMLAVLREKLAKYQLPALRGDIYLIGRPGDTARLRRAIEQIEPMRIVESKWDGGPEAMVMITSSQGKGIFKVYLESLEETFKKWDVAGLELSQLIERLENASRDRK